jgi:hypothetical protein
MLGILAREHDSLYVELLREQWDFLKVTPA